METQTFRRVATYILNARLHLMSGVYPIPGMVAWTIFPVIGLQKSLVKGPTTDVLVRNHQDNSVRFTFIGEKEYQLAGITVDYERCSDEFTFPVNGNNTVQHAYEPSLEENNPFGFRAQWEHNTLVLLELRRGVYQGTYTLRKPCVTLTTMRSISVNRFGQCFPASLDLRQDVNVCGHHILHTGNHIETYVADIISKRVLRPLERVFQPAGGLY